MTPTQVDPVVATRGVGPAPVWELIQGYTRYWTVAAAVELGIFGAIAAGQRTQAALASACAIDGSRLGVLLDALTGLGLLHGDGQEYRLDTVASTFLVPGASVYMGDLVLHSPGLHENWPGLAETIRHGTPRHPVDDDVTFWREFATAAFDVQHAYAASTAAAAAGAGGAAGLRRILELGAGAAPWTIALLQSHPDATAVVNDLDGVLDVARDAVSAHGLSPRVAYLPGDYRRVELPAARFDLVVLANVVRTEGADGAPALLRRAWGALRPGGRALVADYFVDEPPGAALTALLLGVTMVANTRRGATFSVADYCRWLESAGFADIELLHVGSVGAVLVAARPSGETDGHD